MVTYPHSASQPFIDEELCLFGGDFGSIVGDHISRLVIIAPGGDEFLIRVDLAAVEGEDLSITGNTSR